MSEKKGVQFFLYIGRECNGGIMQKKHIALSDNQAVAKKSTF
jgi:hypothetical protein